MRTLNSGPMKDEDESAIRGIYNHAFVDMGLMVEFL